MPNNDRERKNCKTSGSKLMFIIDRVALAKQGDNRIGTVRPFVCGWVCVSVCPSSPV